MSRSGLARRLGLVALAAGLGVLFAGEAGLFEGERPAQLGTTDGRLGPVRTHLQNAVSSTATTDYHRIAPLDASPEPGAAFRRLRGLVVAYPGARVVTLEPAYLYAEFRSRWLGFVDDVEFLLDEEAEVIHVRSASRLGRRDFGVNRARIEKLREGLARPLAP